MKSRFGLHIRLESSLNDAIDKAQRLNMRFFQTILVLKSKKAVELTSEQIEQFANFAKQHCDMVVIHAAYWSNLTDLSGRGFYWLQREIFLAEQLACTHMVIHPGAFTQNFSVDQRVDAIVQAVELLLVNSSRIVFLLENSPHKDRSFSSSLEEFGKLFKKLGHHDRVKMCIDTAHAYVAGYDISTPALVDKFIAQIVQNIGLLHIGLIHCNDTKQYCGSFVDQHTVFEYGNIGMESLYHFVHHQQLQHVPVIFEAPAIDESLEIDMIQQFEAMEILDL